MVREMALIVNTADCVGCDACEVACKQEHNLPVGPKWINVRTNPPRIIDGKPQLRYTVTHCVHCGKPACQEACPVGAVIKRSDGIVLIDENLCTGCKMCIEACPFGVMQFDDEKLLAHKCTLCVERIDKGFAPACASICPAHCIYYGSTSEVIAKIGPQRLLIWYKMV